MYIQNPYRSNPHYKPEISAQCTIINFIVTESGLEDQLLVNVVRIEQPQLEETKQRLQQEFNLHKIELLRLEDAMLEQLANAPEDILSDVQLIEGVEAMKKAANEITDAVEKGKETEAGINEAREVYRSVAQEASMLYFLLLQMSNVDYTYQYSLVSFLSFFYKSLEIAPEHSDILERVKLLCESLRITIYTWTSRSLFERHKLIFLSLLTLELLQRKRIQDTSNAKREHYEFLLRGPHGIQVIESPLSWIPPEQWSAVESLGEIQGFEKLPSDILESDVRFREWCNSSSPETEKLPLDWRELDKAPLLKLLVVRCLRPDRMTVAMTHFVRTVLPHGVDFVDCDSQLSSLEVLEDCYQDSSPETPLYFVLSPGIDVVGDVDRLAKRLNKEKGVNYHNISLGQGQDLIAESTLKTAHKSGHWVLLNNIHLMPTWVKILEQILDEIAQGSHESFRLFLTSEPSQNVPVGVLNRCIKITNEPPTGLKANLKRALCSFPRSEFDEWDQKAKAVTFGLCYFHAIMLERKRYGAKGFNMAYPFGTSDLIHSNIVLHNYMESAGGRVPWQDIKYLFGEILYGGHIVDDWDRLVCNSYLNYFMTPALLDELELFPFTQNVQSSSGVAEQTTYKAPSPSSVDKYLEHIETNLWQDCPRAFGLHPNAEISFRTTMADQLLQTIADLQPKTQDSSIVIPLAGVDTDRMTDSRNTGTHTAAHEIEVQLQDVLDTYRDVRYDIEELSTRGIGDDPTPFQTVFLQECVAMNELLGIVVHTLSDLDLAIRGELTMSDSIESIMNSLYLDRVPEIWSNVSWPSTRPLASWLSELQKRINQLNDWVSRPLDLPTVTWLSGFFYPQSFLTAIMQFTARKGNKELDKLVVVTDVVRTSIEELTEPPRDGVYVYGFYLDGARWDESAGVLDHPKPREMYVLMPPLLLHAEEQRSIERIGIYRCPVYRTPSRGSTFVFTATLRTNAPTQMWILAGVAMLMDIAT